MSIFDRFSKKLSTAKEKRQETCDPAIVRGLLGDGWKVIEYAPSIMKQFDRAIMTNVYLRITREKDINVYMSTICEVNPKENFYLIDCIEADRAVDPSFVGANLQISALIDHIEYFWESKIVSITRPKKTVLKSGVEIMAKTMKAYCPAFLKFYQRRDAFRVYPGVHTPTSVQFEFVNYSGLDSRIIDISVSGVRLWVQTYLNPIVFQVGAELPARMKLNGLEAQIVFKCESVEQAATKMGWTLRGTYAADEATLTKIGKMIHDLEIDLSRNRYVISQTAL